MDSTEWVHWTVDVPSTADQVEQGVALRKVLPRRDQAMFDLPDRDPVALLEQQRQGRVSTIVPLRVARMAESPFAFFRGAAAVQAYDLGAGARSGPHVLINGDAHLANFGYFATPERNLTFELNDFDEASEGPWEWDLKRLATSFVLVAQERAMGAPFVASLAAAVGAAYRTTLAAMIQLPLLDRFYFQPGLVHAGQHLEGVLASQANRARRRTSERLLEKITTREHADGIPRIVDQPPIMYHHHSLAVFEEMTALLAAYQDTMRMDASYLLSQFTMVDAVIRLVGVGSVGTRCGILLLIGTSGHPLFLQFKQAEPSVIEAFGNIHPNPPLQRPPGTGEGLRVINSQRIMQSASDPFLGHFRFNDWDFYMRQFRDMKGAVDPMTMRPAALMDYARACGALLARAHAQSPASAVVSGYLGDSQRFDDALATWSLAYADQVHRDYAIFLEAIASGRLPVAERDRAPAPSTGRP